MLVRASLYLNFRALCTGGRDGVNQPTYRYIQFEHNNTRSPYRPLLRFYVIDCITVNPYIFIPGETHKGE